MKSSLRSKSKLILITAFVLLISLGGLYFAIQSWMPFMWFLLVPGLLGIFCWIFIERKLLIDFFTMKTTKQGLNMGALILIAATLMIFVNFLSVRYNKILDLSATGQYTLSEQSKKVIDQATAEPEAFVQIYFFYKEGIEGADYAKRSFASLVKVYQEYSSKIKFEYIEMNSHPKLTQEFGANKGGGEAFVEYKGQKNRIEGQFTGQGLQNYSEQLFTNALIKTTRKNKKSVYFLQGHNEKNLESEKDETGILSFKQMLEKNSLTVGVLNLIEKNEIPADASAVLIIGPQQKFQKFEIETLQSYLTNGGSLILALDQMNSAGLEGFLDQFGVVHEKQYIFNILNSAMGQVINSQQPTVAIHYSETSAITKVFSKNSSTLFPKPNSLKISNTPAYMKAEVLVRSPEASVALEKLDSVDYKGVPKAYNLAVELSGKIKESAVKNFSAVIFADADFLSNQFIFQNSNRDLAMNTVSSLIQETDLISLSPKEAMATKMILPIPEFNQFYKFVVIFVFLPIPFIFLLISFVMWLRRRHA
jgi:ABC-type uncharacterized transport system involved in gliding motility auxiliary subunit